MQCTRRYDVAVIGAGVFGACTAYQLNRIGRSVLLLDGYGPGNSRASSGGESRIMRLGYGPDEVYTRSAQRSLQLWQELFAQLDNPSPLFHQTGVLWLARTAGAYCGATLKTLDAVGARHARLDDAQLSERFPQLNFAGIDWASLEPDARGLMAGRAVQAVTMKARENGVDYLEEAIAAPVIDRNVRTTSGKQIEPTHLAFSGWCAVGDERCRVLRLCVLSMVAEAVSRSAWRTDSRHATGSFLSRCSARQRSLQTRSITNLDRFQRPGLCASQRRRSWFQDRDRRAWSNVRSRPRRARRFRRTDACGARIRCAASAYVGRCTRNRVACLPV